MEETGLAAFVAPGGFTVGLGIATCWVGFISGLGSVAWLLAGVIVRFGVGVRTVVRVGVGSLPYRKSLSALA